MAKSRKSSRVRQATRPDDEQVKSCRCLCWRFDKSRIGLFRPGYWSDKKETCQNYIIGIIVVGGAGMVGTMIGFVFATLANGGWDLAGGLIGAFFGIFIAIICVFNYQANNRDDYHRNMRKRGPWWDKDNIDYYRERERRRKRKKRMSTRDEQAELILSSENGVGGVRGEERKGTSTDYDDIV